MQAQDVDRAQSRHPPDPGWGWRSSCCKLGTRDMRGRGGAHTGPPGEHQSLWGLLAWSVSTIETAGPGVSQIVSKDSSLETAGRGPWVLWVPGVSTDQGLSARQEGLLSSQELCFLKRPEAGDLEGSHGGLGQPGD